jgi:hypothetical protein
MAKTTKRASLINAADNMTMQLPTMLSKRYSDGRSVGVDGSIWLYRAAPMGPIADAASISKRVESFQPIMSFYEEIERATSIGGLGRRKTSKGQYRDTHMLMVNVNRKFGYGLPPEDMVNYLRKEWDRRIVPQRFVLLGVRLRARSGSTEKNGGIKASVRSFVESIIEGSTPIEEYDEDAKRVGAMFDRSGFRNATDEEFGLADSWWSQGGSPDTVNLAHSDHMHVFTKDTAVAQADRFGKDNCEEWPDSFDGHSIVTFGALESMKFDFIEPQNGFAQWAEPLLSDGVSAISIRAKIEPQTITRTELRQQRKSYERDLNEAAAAGKMDRQEVDEKLGLLTSVENVYATNSGSPTLTDTSIVIAFDGLVEDLDRIAGGASAAVIRKVPFRQQQLLAETMLCSSVMGNPSRHDMPAQTVAASGIQALSVVGDKDGAIIGFTLRDDQIARFSPTAASLADGAPLSLTPGSTGSGKSMTMLWKAFLYDMLPVPGKPGQKITQVIIDPKCLTLDTLIPTPSGWVRNGDIKVGDKVFGRDGKPCTVTALSRLFEETDLYEIEFDDGQIIKADGQHRWVVSDENDRRNMKRVGAHDAAAVRALSADSLYLRDMTTSEIIERGLNWGKRHQSRFSVPLTAPVQMPEAELPVSPYLLGAWLGDGTSSAGEIASGYEDLSDMARILSGEWDNDIHFDLSGHTAKIVFARDRAVCFQSRPDFDGVETATKGSRCTECCSYRRRGVPAEDLAHRSLFQALNSIGVGNNKHIPALYQFASFEQRLALLQGLMDTDGTAKNSGAARITLSVERLARDTLSLVRSFGIKANIWEGVSKISEEDPGNPGSKRLRVTGPHWVVTFRTDLPVFRLQRKLNKMPKTVSKRNSALYIKAIRPVASEPARCIRVDSSDHTYLAAGYVVTHNTGSDHSAMVLARGGAVASLDDMTSADGIFDPLRFARSQDVGVELAVSMLVSIDPYSGFAAQMEVQLYTAISHGVRNGATCIGQALQIAYRDGKASKELIAPIWALLEASPMFRACVGLDPQSKGLSVADGITLIKVGNSHLDLPEPGNMGAATLMQRTALALVRMMVFGSTMAMQGRGGVIHMDEAWVFLGAGKAEVERLGRVARSMNVLGELYTQRVQDALKAELTGYISRIIIMHLKDEKEALAACILANLEPTPERMAMITAGDTIGDGTSEAPNFNSLRALKDPRTGKVIRGSVGIYSDLKGRAVPVEFPLPKSFLDMVSTNPEDVARREAAKAAKLSA